MIDPFEIDDASYLVLVNDLGQHSLWPEAIDVPAGWRTVMRSSRRQDCLDYVAANWADITPRTCR
ncbi:MAG TPA: MbtH family protein [Streptosporangiaceae bacterium]|nr:MbtH family protein [Streptosporangiaceae bacterium]